MKPIIYFSILTLLVGMRPTAPLPDPIVKPCKTLDGKDRPYPCEFQIHTVWFMGKNGEVLAKSTANGQSIKLPMSKAISNTVSSPGGSLFYNVSVDFSRINKASFPTRTYTLSQSTITDPISPGETSVIDKAIKVSPKLPPPFTRPNRILFKLQLNYSGSGSETILVAPIQLIELENPVYFAKKPNQVTHFRDWAEAWRTMQVSVDFKK